MNALQVDEQYLKIAKRYALLSGVWPDQKKSTKHMVRLVSLSISISMLICQVARILHYRTSDVLVEQSTLLTPGILLFLKQGNYMLNSTKLKSLLHSVYKDWSINRPKEEFAIMSVYAKRGSFFAMFYLVNAYICLLLFVQVPWTARLLTKFHIVNSTTKFYVVPGYYFGAEEKYYFLKNIHGSVAVFVTLLVFVAADTGYTVLVQHGCGLMGVAGYRFKHAISDDVLSGHKTIDRAMVEVYRRACLSIKAHEHAIAYLKEIESAHTEYLFLAVGLIVVCFSITLIKVVSMEPCVETYKYISFLIVQLMHLFYLTIQGQFVIDMTDEVYNKIYEGYWYKSNPRIQLLYVLALRRSLTPPRLTAGGLIQLNMQSFSEIIKLSVSYYTVLRST